MMGTCTSAFCAQHKSIVAPQKSTLVISYFLNITDIYHLPEKHKQCPGTISQLDLHTNLFYTHQYGDYVGIYSINVWYALVFEDVGNSGIDLFWASFRFQVGSVLFVAIKKGFTWTCPGRVEYYEYSGKDLGH